MRILIKNGRKHDHIWVGKSILRILALGRSTLKSIWPWPRMICNSAFIVFDTWCSPFSCIIRKQQAVHLKISITKVYQPTLYMDRPPASGQVVQEQIVTEHGNLPKWNWVDYFIFVLGAVLEQHDHFNKSNRIITFRAHSKIFTEIHGPKPTGPGL